MEVVEQVTSRDKTIVKTGIIGIVTNAILAAIKAVVGFASGSIAIILDAVNNLSDALSSVITIVGIKIAGKSPDKEHPFGYGRVEYLTAIVIGVIILYTGGTSVVESAKKIISPSTPSYDTISLVLIAILVVVKFALGLYTQRVGQRVNSDSLIASGVDAKFDALISLSTLLAALVFVFFGVSLEAYLGVVISLLLIKAALEILRDAIDKILGERMPSSESSQIYECIGSFDGVLGAYDLIFNDYGPDKKLGSVHIEVAHDMNAAQIDALTRRIQNEIFAKFNIVLDTIGIYAFDKENNATRLNVEKIVFGHKFIKQMHGFYINKETNTITFDIVIDFNAPDSSALYREILSQVSSAYPSYKVIITRDTDYNG